MRSLSDDLSSVSPRKFPIKTLDFPTTSLQIYNQSTTHHLAPRDLVSSLNVVYLFSVHFTVLSIAQTIARRMIRWLVNEKQVARSPSATISGTPRNFPGPLRAGSGPGKTLFLAPQEARTG